MVGAHHPVMASTPSPAISIPPVRRFFGSAEVTVGSFLRALEAFFTSTARRAFAHHLFHHFAHHFPHRGTILVACRLIHLGKCRPGRKSENPG